MTRVEKVLGGDVRSTAQLIRDIDDNMPIAIDDLKELYKHTGKAYVLGITGPPGAGKSTLVDQITASFRQRGKTVGILAIDPTSPFTGGAILGDRIRMNRHATDEGVFIRSLGTRGALGGLSRSTSDVALVLDAYGVDIIIIETVGVGQDEVDIVKTAHTTCVVMVPGLGDDIQAIKAGILEIGDIFVVNKADRDGADKTVRELEMMLDMRKEVEDAWKPNVMRTQAASGSGIEELVDRVLEHQKYLYDSGEIEEFLKHKSEVHFLEILKEDLIKRAKDYMEKEKILERSIEDIAKHKSDPYSASELVIKGLIKY